MSDESQPDVAAEVAVAINQLDPYHESGNICYAISAQQDDKWRKNGYGGDGFRTGKFTKEETEIVKQAVEDYCSLKNITVERLCSECDHKAELKGAWTEISKSLPNRSVQSVYRHGLRQLHPYKRGAWSESECDLLMDLVTKLGKKWSVIGVKMNRSADSCRDKYREMDQSFVRGRWKEEETERLMQLIREHLNADKTADMKDLGKMVEQEGIRIAWSVISKRMGKRSRLSCFKKWQKMTGLFSQDPHVENEVTVQEIEDSPTIPNVKGDKTSLIKVEAAPTAGTAAAIAAGISITIGEPTEADLDQLLLSELAECNVIRLSDIDWDTFRVENAQERWQEILDGFQATTRDDSILAMSPSEIAQHILDQKTSAQRAAETVEAVDLPAPEVCMHVKREMLHELNV